ncbi:MAG: hypothetical protein M1820_006142 [Bogoriella megaspora]|nr:MAG: hypothetical protein M1820_006142 [Bogoriella megaspora]
MVYSTARERDDNDYPFALEAFRHWAVAFFPERQDSDSSGDLAFHYAISNRSPDISLRSPRSPHGSAGLFHASCIFRQEADSLSKRNYEQKTLILVSHHEFPSFFHRLVREITSKDVISNPDALMAACTQIAQWPAPLIGKQTLPFLGSLVDLNIAPHKSLPLQGLQLSSTAASKDTSPTIYAYQPTASWDKIIRYFPSLWDIYKAFEKIMLSESVVVLAKNPQVCSEVISALVDLCRPVPYAGHCRPYIIMQSEFFSSNLERGPHRSFIVGITNPFLLKRLMALLGKASPPYILYLRDGHTATPLKADKEAQQKRSNNELPGSPVPHPHAKSYIKPDLAFLASLDEMMANNNDSSLSPTIRRHFSLIAAQFLAPFNRYFATLMSSVVTSPGGNLNYHNFSESDFMANLARHGSSVPFKGNSAIARHRSRDALYSAFCRSASFYSWLEMKLSLEKEASAGLLGS